MRIIAADWMGNTSHLAGQASRLREEGVGVPVTFRTRPAAPTAGQVSLRLQMRFSDLVIIHVKVFVTSFYLCCQVFIYASKVLSL